MRYLTACLLLLGASSLGATEAWRWVDKDGSVHFSDQPTPGAERVQLRGAPKPGSVAPPRTDSSRETEGPSRPPPPFRYTGCSISSPAQDEVFNGADAVVVSIDVLPGFRAGDRVEVTLNGQRVKDWPETSTSFAFMGLDRGSYSLSVTIVSADGQRMCTASPVGFHVRQPSLLSPGHRAAPRS